MTSTEPGNLANRRSEVAAARAGAGQSQESWHKIENSGRSDWPGRRPLDFFFPLGTTDGAAKCFVGGCNVSPLECDSHIKRVCDSEMPPRCFYVVLSSFYVVHCFVTDGASLQMRLK